MTSRQCTAKTDIEARPTPDQADKQDRTSTKL